MKSNIRWEARYSETEIPDKQGRWARKCFYKDRQIAWVNRLDVSGVVKFSATAYFPVNGNDMPLPHFVCENFDDAKNKIESLWAQFLNFCK